MRSVILGLAAFLVTLLATDVASAGCRTAGHHFGGGYGASYGVGANFAPSYSYGATVSLVPQYTPPVVSLALPSYSPPVALAVPACADAAYAAYAAPLLVPTYSYAPSFAFFAPSYGFHGGFHGRHR